MGHRARLVVSVCVSAVVIVSVLLWLAFFGSSFTAPGLAATLSDPANQFPPLSSKDAVLIVAPHPDDECIATGGLIQQAIAVGARVHVVYLTYGDNHEIAYWALRKIPALTPAQYRSLGETRRAEAIQGTTSLGLKPDDLTFLGYPDTGTLRIWESTWQPGTSRYHLATGTRVVPYGDAQSPGSPYNAAAILTDFTSVVHSFNPTVVAFPSPLDLNPDHQAAYLFTAAALFDLGVNPQRYTYIVHLRHFPMPRLYNPLAVLTPPSFVASLPLPLYSLKLTAGQVSLKYTSTMLYRSQTDVSYSLLASFCRQNEVFMADKNLRLTSEIAPFFLIPSDFLLERFGRNFELRSLTASKPSAETLRLVLSFPVAPTEESVAEVSVFTARNGAPFADQPKLLVELQHGKETAATDLVTGSSVSSSVVTTESGTEVTIDIDMAQAAQASLIMLHVRAGYRGLNLYATPWQVFSLPK
jgi:LmbE family N-acetylglucosaminyl deacetylase